MKEILYTQLKEVEGLNDKLNSNISQFYESLKAIKNYTDVDISLENVPKIDVSAIQKRLIFDCSKNPIIYDAIYNHKSLEETLNELSQVNKGVKKMLPRRKDEIHNEKLKQLGELIGYPSQLECSGVFSPDNFATVAAGCTIFAFGFCYLFSKYVIMQSADITKEESELITYYFGFVAPTTVSVTAAPLAGFLASSRRFGDLPIEEARYIDNKIKELF